MDSLFNNSVKVLNKKHREQVNTLRKAAYHSAKGFKVNDVAIEWNRSDDQCTILGIYDRNTLAATMRIELVDTPEMIENKLEYPFTFHDLSFPAMILSKAATHRHYVGRGFNAVLRFHALQLAKVWNVRYLLGTFVDGSPRIRSMQKMGYRFYENPEGWYAVDYHSERKVLIASLDMQKYGDQAIAITEEIARANIIEYPFIGDLPNPKIVRVIK